MVNQEIVSTSIFAAQSKVWGQLKQISLSDKLGSAYLFSGQPGCGKEGIAIQFAKLLNCESSEGNICENCPSCIKITNTHCLHDRPPKWFYWVWCHSMKANNVQTSL